MQFNKNINIGNLPNLPSRKVNSTQRLMIKNLMSLYTELILTSTSTKLPVWYFSMIYDKIQVPGI